MLNVVNRLLKRIWFPVGAQIFTFIIFILLIIIGLKANTDDMAFAKILRNTNAANLIVWSYWWPLIIISAVFLGRVWCMICPMELVTTLCAKMGLRRKPPAFLHSGWVITLFYVLILFVGIHTLAIHRVPYRMAVFMILLLITSAGSGLLFRRNTFCAHICPVGHLLGLYARLAPLGWGVRHQEICNDCKDKSCISSKTAYHFQGRSCGVGLYPVHLDQNTDCLLCGQCLKACDHNNPGIEQRPNPGWFRRQWFKDVLTLLPFTAAQAVFALVVSGFVIYEVFTEWSVTSGLLLWLPETVSQTVNADGIWGIGLIKSITLFAALPTFIWLLPFGLFRLFGGHLGLSDYFLKFGIAFIPIMGAAHVVKALLKMTSRLPYWAHTISDPVGIKSANDILQNSSQLSVLPVWRDPTIMILSLLLMVTAIALSFVIVRQLIAAHVAQFNWKALVFYLIPFIYGGGFLIMLIGWSLF